MSNATAGPLMRSRNGTQSPEWVGLPCRNTAGGPSPGTRRQKVSTPSTTIVCSVIPDIERAYSRHDELETSIEGPGAQDSRPPPRALRDPGHDAARAPD